MAQPCIHKLSQNSPSWHRRGNPDALQTTNTLLSHFSAEKHLPARKWIIASLKPDTARIKMNPT